MKLLPELDTSWMGEPDPEKIALDNLGGFSQRNVVDSFTSGKTKKFIIEYVGFGKFNLRISYEEKAGQVKAVYWAYLEK